jgi:hypothetical protein
MAGPHTMATAYAPIKAWIEVEPGSAPAAVTYRRAAMQPPSGRSDARSALRQSWHARFGDRTSMVMCPPSTSAVA